VVIEDFERTIAAFYDAVEKNDTAAFNKIDKNFIRHNIGDKSGPDGFRGSRLCLLTAIDNNNYEMVTELLGLEFRTPDNNDALAFAAGKAIYTKGDYDILDYMLSRLNRYGDKLYSFKGTSAGNTALTYILQNNNYLLKYGWNGIRVIFHRLWEKQDKYREQIIHHIITLETDGN